MRLINWFEQYRRIVALYEKRATNHLAMVTLGMTRFWLTWLCRNTLVRHLTRLRTRYQWMHFL